MQRSYNQRIKDIASNFIDEYLDSTINSLGYISAESKKSNLLKIELIKRIILIENLL